MRRLRGECYMKITEHDREFLKANIWREWEAIETDQKKQIPPPPAQKPFPQDATLIDLVKPEELKVGKMSVIEAITHRKSRRQYTAEPITIEELSFLLWSTQGVHEVLYDGVVTLRTVPSAGARHPFETYLLVNHVVGLQAGVYRYLSFEHKLCILYPDPKIGQKIALACDNFARNSAVVFVWAAIPYRTEWRYGVISPKLIAQDSGHVCQNLYLACEAIGVGTCAVGAYNQKEMDKIIGVDGEEEFTVYTAPVGKVRE
jgi:SagB-type dehydrogenase family enzyme